MIGVGFALQPDVEFLERCDELIQLDVDYYEVAPETLWRAPEDESPEAGDDEGDRAGGRAAGDGGFEPNGFHRRFARLREETGRPFVAHGVGLSLGTSARSDAARRTRWLARVAADQRVFRFRWYTDHLGASAPFGRALQLPVPLPMTAEAARVVRAQLRRLQAIVPDVGVENNVAYFLLGDALEEPGFLAACTRAPRTHLLLDLHNLYTMACNFGFEPEQYLERLDLSRVIEIHLSGGMPSEPGWLPSGRVLRLDSHDAAVPEPVWALFASVQPRCPRLRGVTLERMEGTVGDDDVPLLRDELRRARALVGSRGSRGRR